MKKVSKKDKDALRPEYKLSDFPRGFVRGKYVEFYPEGVTVAPPPAPMSQGLPPLDSHWAVC